MLTTSRVLSEIIKSSVSQNATSVNDYRLIVPGLTAKIASEVHSAIHEQTESKCFFVIGADRSPSEERKLIRPESLTSMRIGSFVAVCDPGAFVNIQDSVRGTGGTVRSVAFSEEWPWYPRGNPEFDFMGPFLDKLLQEWGVLSNEDIGWFKQLIDGVLKRATCYGFRNREQLLLEKILGEFDNSKESSLVSVRERFLFHCGIPKPNDASEPPELEKEICKLIAKILERVADKESPELRQQIKDSLSESGAERDRIICALDVFFDGLANVSPVDPSILSFMDCWGSGADALENWKLLTAKRLSDLFEVRDRSGVKFNAVHFADSSPVGLLNSEKKIAVCSADSELILHVDYEIPEEEFSSSSYSLLVKCRTKKLFEKDLDEAAALLKETIGSIDGHDLAYKKRVPINVSILRDNEVVSQAFVYVHAYGEKRQCFVVTMPKFYVDDAVPTDPGSTNTPIEHFVDEPVSMHLFWHQVDKQPDVTDDDGYALSIEGGSGDWRTEGNVDVFGKAQMEATYNCAFEDYSVSITYQAVIGQKGEFTLEDELRVRIAAGDKNKTDEIIKIHSQGSRKPYSRLGGLTKEAISRKNLASYFETDDGWKPLLFDNNAGLSDSVDSLGEHCRGFSNVDQTDEFHDLSLDIESMDLLNEYIARRKIVRDTILSTLETAGEKDNEFPQYARHPIFLMESAQLRSKIEVSISQFLAKYYEIIHCLKRNAGGLAWHQAFTMAGLDCAVEWGRSSTKNQVFILNPWHPLVVAKRFMVQHSLVMRGARLVNHGDKKFCKLTNKLSEIEGFKWYPCLSTDSYKMEVACVVPTKDPGWHCAFQKEIFDNSGHLHESLENLHANFGIEACISSPKSSGMIEKVVKGFSKVFPAKRHVGVYFSKEYHGHDEINVTNQLLHKDDKPTLEGDWLPGGVTLSFASLPLEIPEGVVWENPPIDVLIYDSWEKCHSETHTDIRFCSPQSDQKLRPSDEEDVALPRGKGLSAVYSQPLHEIETGAANIPKSRTVGWDRELDQAEDDIGSIFLKTCGLAAHISGRRYGLIESVDLPRKLGANWAVVPAATIDPALFRDYVTKETGIPFEDRALWDYRISLSYGSSSYFILSAVPPAYKNAVNGVFDGDHASSFIAELGSVGLAIAGEAMKSGQHALGTIGQVAAVRFFIGAEDLRGPLAWGQNHIGFLLPVDAFDEFFDEKEDAASESDLTRKRGDFLAVSVTFPTNQNDAIVIQAVGVECKYRSKTYSSNNAKDGLKQAKVVTDWFKKLCKLAQEEDGIAERLGLLHLMWFGARISGQECPERKELEQRLFEAVLRGEFNFKKAAKPGVLISTEIGFRGAAAAVERADGLWARLNKENWPGIHETDSIRLVRAAISKLFDVGGIGGVTQEAGNSASINSVENTPGDQGEEALLEGQDVDSGVSEVMGEATGGSVHQEQVEETTASTTAISHQAEGVQLEKILVGMDNDRNTVFFDPHSESTPLDNTNLMVTGSSGKGKTQFIKYFVSQLRGQGVNAIVLDLKGDLIGDRVWCENARLEPIHVNFDGLPYNPMIPFPVTHPRTGDLLLDTAGHISALADVFERTYGLGVQQQSHVKEAIRQAFQEREISPREWVPFDENLIFPDFSQIEDFLREEDEQAYNRLDNLFSLRLFRDEYRQTSFASITEGSKLIGLGGIGSQELRNAIAEMIILSAHAFYTSRPTSSGMKQIFVVDEAHRICEADYVIKFLRECRSFGVGFLLASQFIGDFSPSITGCMATKVIHGNEHISSYVREISSLLGCRGQENEIGDLALYEAIFSNKNYNNTFIQTMSYPLQLALEKIKQAGVDGLPRSELSRVDGLQPDKVGNILLQLERRGLVVQSGDIIKPL